MTSLELTSLGWLIFFGLAFAGVLFAGIWFAVVNGPNPACDCEDCVSEYFSGPGRIPGDRSNTPAEPTDARPADFLESREQ